MSSMYSASPDPRRRRGLAWLCALAIVSTAPLHAQRFLYVGDCTYLRRYVLEDVRRSTRIDLAALPSLRPFPAGKAGCPLVAASAVPRAPEALLVATETPPNQDHATLLEVTLPGLQLKATLALPPAGEQLHFQDGLLVAESGQRFQITPATGKTIKLTPAPAAPSLLAGLPVSTPPESGPQVAPALDLSGFNAVSPALRPFTVDGAGKELPVIALARSGPVVLAGVSGSPALRPVLVVVDPAARRLDLLAQLPATTSDHVHLAPGGQTLLVEEVMPLAGPLGPRRTGRLLLLDAHTGRLLKQAQLPPAARQAAQFLKLLPNGHALYASRTGVFSIPLAPAFPDAPVSVPEADQPASLVAFFADR